MKKCFKYLLTAIITTVLFSSCFDPVFYSVLQDVPPETATVSGPITSIARYTTTDSKEFLFLAATNGLRYKELNNAEHGSWKIYPEKSLPFVLHYYDYYGDGNGDSSKNPEGKVGHIGQQITKVMANETTLFLITVEYNQDDETGTSCPKQFHIWATELTSSGSSVKTDNTWTDIYKTVNNNNQILSFYKDTSASLYYTTFSAFFTNTPQKGNRKAYIRSGTDSSAKVYELTGTSVIADISTTSVTPVMLGTDNPGKINSAAYLGGYKFLASIAAATNETADTPATYIYYGDDEVLMYYDGTTSKKAFAKDQKGKSSTELKTDIASLAVTNDSLLIGMGDFSKDSSIITGGIARTTLTAGVPGTETVNFTTNASVQISDYYQIYSLLVTDPALSETEAVIYAAIGFKGSGSSSSVSYNDIGLWSYYPARGNWNRE